MSEEWSYLDALRELWRRSSYERGYISNPFGDQASGERGLTRTRRLLAALGDPDSGQAIVHVAGSKGKGSTATMIAAIGDAAGYRSGLYTSPHLHAFRERIAVAGAPVSETAFAKATRRAATAAARFESTDPYLGQVTTFELLTAMALDEFRREGCRLTVLEVGLGGTFDATNVINPVVSVITALDLEHTAVLGSSLAEIARAKAGIIKPGRPVVVSPQPAAILSILAGIAADRDSELHAADAEWSCDGTWQDFAVTGPWGTYANLRSRLPGHHQVENAATAISAIWELTRAGFPVTEAAIRAGLGQVRLVGRFERHTTANGATVIFDGAHSPGSARVLAQAMQSEYPGRKAIVVLGTSADKDIAAIGRALTPVATLVIATRSSNPRAAAPEQVAAGLSELGLEVEQEAGVARAVERAIAHADENGLVLVTGSLFVVADAREALSLGVPDPDYTS